jgi:ATP-binding cassette subfamily B protein
MEHGDIVEKGSHDELIAAKGAYYRLYNSQFEHAATDLDAEEALRDGTVVRSAEGETPLDAVFEAAAEREL